MSSGFAGSATRSLGKLERELESRGKDVDVQPDKNNGGYQKPHDDTIPEADKRFIHMAAAGNAEDQPPLDALDRIEQRYQAAVKPYKDQFPGSQLKGKNDE